MGNMSEISFASVETADERDAKEIKDAVSSMLASDKAMFVKELTEGKFAATAICHGLGDVASEVREAALMVGRAALSEVDGDGSKYVEALEAYLQSQCGGEPGSHAEDNTSGGIIALYGHAAQVFCDDEGKVRAIEKIVSALSGVKDNGAFIGARSIGNLAADVR